MTLLGETMVSARSQTGRRWRVESFSASTDEYRLTPLGRDVQAAQDEHGRMQGGVRRITVGYARLHDTRYWRTG